MKFGPEEILAAWRQHPEHRQAQQQGRESFYQSYQVQASQVLREYAFDRKVGWPLLTGKWVDGQPPTVALGPLT